MRHTNNIIIIIIMMMMMMMMITTIIIAFSLQRLPSVLVVVTIFGKSREQNTKTV